MQVFVVPGDDPALLGVPDMGNAVWHEHLKCEMQHNRAKNTPPGNTWAESRKQVLHKQKFKP